MPLTAAREISHCTMVRGYHPATFGERGLVVPTTTPELTGARITFSDDSRLELILPNMSGAAGVYIIPVTNVGMAFCLTLHDRAIFERVNGLIMKGAAITPGVMRDIALAVAVEGLAGRAAARAAAIFIANREQDHLLVQAELLRELLRQVETPISGWVPPEQVDDAELARRVSIVVRTVSQRTGGLQGPLTPQLGQLATLFGSVGIGRQSAGSRVAQMLEKLVTLETGLETWRDEQGGANPDVAAVLSSAKWTRLASQSALRGARGALADLPQLLRLWSERPDQVQQLVMLPEWLLDGWERICLLWMAADERIDHHLALGEMVAVLPTLPSEIEVGDAYPRPASDPEIVRLRRRAWVAASANAGMTGADSIARNEQLRALAPTGPE